MYRLIHQIPLQIFFSLFVFSLALPEVTAQSAGGDDPVLVQADFSFYTWKKRVAITRVDEENTKKISDELPDLFYFNGSGWVKVSLSSGIITRSYSYKGPLPVHFYTSIPEDPAKAEPLFSAQFPLAWNKVLFLLKPGGDGRMGAFPVDRSAAKLKPGTVRMYNLGDKPILYRAGEHQATLNRGEHDQFSIKNLSGYYLPVQIASEHNGKPQLAYSKKLSVNRESRLLLLAYHSDLDSASWQLRTLVIPEL